MHKIAFSALAVAVAVLLTREAVSQPPPPLPASKALVVDMNAIVAQCKEQQVVTGKLKKEQDLKKKEFEGKIRSLQLKFKALSEKKQLSEHDKKYYAEIEANMRERGNLQAAAARLDAEYKDRIAKALRGILVEIRSSAHMIAKKRGADLVLVSNLGKISIETEQEFADEVVMRRVLYIRKGLDVDITQDVLREVNRRYNEREKAKESRE